MGPCSLDAHPGFRLAPVAESITFDPALNLERETAYMREVEVPTFRVWRSSDSVVLGRFLLPEDEVHLERADELGVPVLHRSSGGGAVFHDLGNLNYSIYLPCGHVPSFRIEDRLRALSFPVIFALERYGLPWSWGPPNNVLVMGRKVSGSAQAHSGGRLLHHGTLLVDTDTDRMFELLKPGGRSCFAPVANLAELAPGITVEAIWRALLEAFDDPAQMLVEVRKSGSRVR